MQNLITGIRYAAVGLKPRPAVALAIMLGLAAGALLAEAAIAAQAPKEVVIDNFTFVPANITISAGTTVKWTNHDDIPHTVVDTNKAFRSRALDTNDSYSFTFSTAGTYRYFCSLHPQMVGQIVVK